MRIQAIIQGHTYTLDYCTDHKGQVCGVTIYDENRTDVTELLEFSGIPIEARDIARQHNANRQLVAEHAPSPAVPAIPAQVAVPHALEAPPAKKWAAIALNTEAHLSAIHAIHVNAIAANSSNTIKGALVRTYVALEKEVRDEFARAQRAGGLLFAFHGSKAFEVAA